MQKLSAVIITQNEASNIEACVSALMKVANEVLVFDSKSTDQTIVLAKNLGAKVVSTEWEGYAATKNKANLAAKNDWILSIDADEVLSEELIKSLSTLTLDESKVYALDRLTNFCGQWIKHSGWYPEWKTRLFNKKHTFWEGDFVHEKLVHSKPVHVQKISGKLFHYSYKSKSDHWARIEKYAELSAQEMHTKGKQSNFIKLWISPLVRFLKTYFLKLGFLDGKNGWLISVRNAKLVHLKYRLLQKLNKK